MNLYYHKSSHLSTRNGDDIILIRESSKCLIAN